jgi:hypothetical protein
MLLKETHTTPHQEVEEYELHVLKGERGYEVKQLIDCRLKGEARPDYILSSSTGKLRPSPPLSNSMRGRANKKYLFVKAEIEKFRCKVRSMAIHNKKPPLSPCFLPCLSVKNLLKPC